MSMSESKMAKHRASMLRCPGGNKVGYRTRKKAIAGISKHRPPVGAKAVILNKLYPYSCPNCNNWHLTSSKPRSK
jgi:hypothetical protein